MEPAMSFITPFYPIHTLTYQLLLPANTDSSEEKYQDDE
jgi:hypothetical protein